VVHKDGRDRVPGSPQVRTETLPSSFSIAIINVTIYRGHSSYINAVAVCDTYVITGSADSTIRKWDMTTCECLFVYEGHTARIQR
jgi:WD40 repeat protein